MRLLSLLLLAPVVLSATYQSCTPFVNTKADKPGYINVTSTQLETSILIYNIHDVPKTNIPFEIDQRVIQSELNGFTVCSQKSQSMGYCDNVGEFTVVVKEGEKANDVYNQVLKKGDGHLYEIKKEGVYCIVAYQENDSTEVKGVDHENIYSYGALTFDQYVHLQTVSLILGVEIILFLGFKFGFRKTINNLSLPHEIINDLLAVSVSFHVLEFLALKFANLGKNLFIFNLNSDLNLWSSLSSIFFYSIFFAASLNESVYDTNSSAKARLLKYNYFKNFKSDHTRNFRVLLGVLITKNLLVDVLRVPLPQPIAILLGLISSIIWLPIWRYYNKNIKLVSDDILDPIYLRNFKLSKKFSFTIPIVLSVVPSFYLSVLSLVQQYDEFKGTVDLNNAYNSSDIFANSFSLVTSHTVLMVLRAPDYSILVIVLGLLLIWRPKVVERATVGELSLETDHEQNVVISDSTFKEKV